MINILVPIAGQSIFFENSEYKYPKPLIEIGKKPMIEWVINNFNQIKEEKKYIFIVNKQNCIKYHLDDTLKLLTDNNCEIIQIDHETKGAACSCLMAIQYINNDKELIITNGDQIIDTDLNKVLTYFRKKDADGGVICFESVHPKWSYVRLDMNNKIIETAEKRPLSKEAIAGFYYFKKGKDFVNAAMKSIKKNSSVDGLYFIAPVYNELVLDNKYLITYKIDGNKYNNFYSPQRIEEFEKGLSFRN